MSSRIKAHVQKHWMKVKIYRWSAEISQQETVKCSKEIEIKVFWPAWRVYFSCWRSVVQGRIFEIDDKNCRIIKDWEEKRVNKNDWRE